MSAKRIGRESRSASGLAAHAVTAASVGSAAVNATTLADSAVKRGNPELRRREDSRAGADGQNAADPGVEVVLATLLDGDAAPGVTRSAALRQKERQLAQPRRTDWAAASWPR